MKPLLLLAVALALTGCGHKANHTASADNVDLRKACGDKPVYSALLLAIGKATNDPLTLDECVKATDVLFLSNYYTLTQLESFRGQAPGRYTHEQVLASIVFRKELDRLTAKPIGQ